MTQITITFANGKSIIASINLSEFKENPKAEILQLLAAILPTVFQLKKEDTFQGFAVRFDKIL